MKKTSTPAHYRLIIPRRRNKELIEKIAREHPGAERVLPLLDATKIEAYMRIDKDLWRVMRWTEGKLQVLIEIPVVRNFELKWHNVADMFRADIIEADVQFGFIVDREVAHTRELLSQANGRRYDIKSEKELSLEVFPDGPQKVVEDIRKKMRSAPILETTSTSLETDLPQLLEAMKPGKWRWE